MRIPRLPGAIAAVVGSVVLALVATTAVAVDPEAGGGAAPPDDGLIHLEVGDRATVDFGDGRTMEIEYVGHGFAVQGGKRPQSEGKLLDPARWPASQPIDEGFAREVKADLATIYSWGNEGAASKSLPLGKQLLDFVERARPLKGDAGDSPRDYMFTNSEGKPYAVNVIVGKAGAGGNVHFPLNDARSQYTAAGGRKAGLGSVAFVDYSQTYSNFLDAKGKEIYYSPAQTLAHESGHAAHSIGGSRNSKAHTYQVKDPRTGKQYRMSERAKPGARESVEESRTVGDAEALMQFAGYKVDDARKVSLPPFEGDTASVKRAVEEASRLPRDTPEWQAAADAVGLRAGIAGINDKSLFAQAGLESRPHYGINPDAKYFASNGTVEWTKELQRGLPTAKKADGSPLFRPVAERDVIPSCVGDGLECVLPSPGEVTDAQIKEGEKAVADYEEAVRAGNEPEAGLVDNKLIPELSPAELQTYAEARVTHAMATYEAAPSEFRPGQFGFTSDLKVAMKNPTMIFQPFGGAKTVKGTPPARLSKALTQGWSAFNTALTPVMAYMWIDSITQAFGQDASDLTKSAVVLAPVPVIGQLVGIADSAERKDGVGLAVNLLYLLAEASEFAGQPELAMLLGVVALVTQIVVGIADWVNRPSQVDQQIEGRNKAWHDTMKKEVIEKSIPALLSAAQKAFDAAQKKVMFAAYATMAQLNAKAAKTGSSVVMAAVRTANARTMANANASVESLRSGFINGVHQSVTDLFGALNKGTGSDVFTKAYLDKTAFPAWYKDIWVPKQPKVCAGNGMPFAPCGSPDPRKGRAEWERDVVPGVLADTPKDLFTAGDLKDVQGAVDNRLNKAKMFAPLAVSDTTPVAPTGFIPCADNGGTCAGIEGRTGQVAFGAAGKYVTTALPPGGIACKASSFPTDPNPSAHETCFVPAGDNTSGGDGGSWLSSVVACADEGAKCTVSGAQQVAFGAGANWIVRPVTSSAACDSGEDGFGADPAPGTAKKCLVLAGSPPGQAANAGGPYQACAVQGEHCHVTGKVRLAFGAHVSDEERGWVYKDVDGDAYPNGVPCTSSTFGKDPLPGEAEGCYIAHPPARFAYCSGPGGTCSVPDSGTFQVAYGGNGSWVVKTVRGGNVTCNEATFGEVVAPKGTRGHCFLSTSDYDLVLGEETHHEGQSVNVDWASHACARDGGECKVDGPTVMAYGTYESHQRRGTYLVRPFTPGADQTATLCSSSGFTPRDPQLGVAYCFLLTAPTLGFDTAQTDFVHRETKRTDARVGPPEPGDPPRPEVPDPHGADGHAKKFRAGFESGDFVPAWTDRVDEERGGVENVGGRNGGPGPLASPRTGETAHTGGGSLSYSGSTRGGVEHAHAYLKVFDLADKPVSIGKAKTLSYWIYPKGADRWDNMDWPVNNSNCVAVDLVFTDGTTLRDSGAVDQGGSRITPAAQCERLKPNQWNHVTVNLAGKTSGKEISRINVGYDQNYPGNADYSGYLDDIDIS